MTHRWYNGLPGQLNDVCVQVVQPTSLGILQILLLVRILVRLAFVTYVGGGTFRMSELSPCKIGEILRSYLQVSMPVLKSDI